LSADVSVIVPAYNAQATLAAALRSALQQSVPPLEVLVVDDGSVDGTAAVAETFGPQVRLIRQPNGGPGAARNTGIRAARGAWIGLLDADDTWLPTKLEHQLALDDDPGIGIIACLSDKPGQACPPEIGFDQLWNNNLLVNSTVLLRRLGGGRQLRRGARPDLGRGLQPLAPHRRRRLAHPDLAGDIGPLRARRRHQQQHPPPACGLALQPRPA